MVSNLGYFVQTHSFSFEINNTHVSGLSFGLVLNDLTARTNEHQPGIVPA